MMKIIKSSVSHEIDTKATISANSSCSVQEEREAPNAVEHSEMQISNKSLYSETNLLNALNTNKLGYVR